MYFIAVRNQIHYYLRSFRQKSTNKIKQYDTKIEFSKNLIIALGHNYIIGITTVYFFETVSATVDIHIHKLTPVFPWGLSPN